MNININTPKLFEKNDIFKNRVKPTKLVYSNSLNDFDTEIMPANNMNSFYKKKI